MKVLLAEDDRLVRITVRDALVDAGFKVTECVDGTAAARALDAGTFDVLLSDVRLPGVNGITLFRQARRLHPPLAVLLMTAYGDTGDAVTVMREGARDYLLKPFELAELLLRMERLRHEVFFLRRMEQGSGAAACTGNLSDVILGDSPSIRLLRERIEAAAASEVAVLLTGETGTGKDLAARLIHERGLRAGKPLVAVNCAAIPETLFESEMFGHEKGAFTGAERRRVGRFEAAHGGTLFLNEVGDLSLTNQAKLLQALETQTFEPVGASRPLKVDIRVIAATNRDLHAEMDRGAFRRDLFFRLNVVDLKTPSLRERRADIPLLVKHFLETIAARNRRPVPVLSPSAAAALATHEFPGNVRELLHGLERAIALSRSGTVRLENLPDEIARGVPTEAPEEPTDGPRPLEEATGQFERQYIERVLERTGGHRGRTAALLGISRKSLWERLREAQQRPTGPFPSPPSKDPPERS